MNVKDIVARTALVVAFVAVLALELGSDGTAAVRSRYSRAHEIPDRGDVPGWVLVTLMTAGLVVALWALAGPMLANLFTDAVMGVSGP